MTLKVALIAAVFVSVSAPTLGQDNKERLDKDTFSDFSAMAPLDRLTAVIDQAVQAQEAGRVALALALYKEASMLTPALGEKGTKAYLIIKYRELALQAAGLEWRRVEHRFEDLRKIADQHPLWTDSQLERALAEAEIRLVDQPSDDETKEETLRLLHKEIELIVKSMGNGISPQMLARSREFGYALEDNYGERKLIN